MAAGSYSERRRRRVLSPEEELDQAAGAIDSSRTRLKRVFQKVLGDKLNGRVVTESAEVRAQYLQDFEELCLAKLAYPLCQPKTAAPPDRIAILTRTIIAEAQLRTEAEKSAMLYEPPRSIGRMILDLTGERQETVRKKAEQYDYSLPYKAELVANDFRESIRSDDDAEVLGNDALAVAAREFTARMLQDEYRALDVEYGRRHGS